MKFPSWFLEEHGLKKSMSRSIIWLQECSVRSARHARDKPSSRRAHVADTPASHHSPSPVSNTHSLSLPPLCLGNATWHSYTQKAFVTGEKMLLLWAASLFLLPWEWCAARSHGSLRGSHNWGLLALTTPHWADDSTPSIAHSQASYCARNII